MPKDNLRTEGFHVPPSSKPAYIPTNFPSFPPSSFSSKNPISSLRPSNTNAPSNGISTTSPTAIFNSKAPRNDYGREEAGVTIGIIALLGLIIGFIGRGYVRSHNRNSISTNAANDIPYSDSSKGIVHSSPSSKEDFQRLELKEVKNIDLSEDNTKQDAPIEIKISNDNQFKNIETKPSDSPINRGTYPYNLAATEEFTNHARKFGPDIAKENLERAANKHSKDCRIA